jgi:glycosyltransferase involved in cell wall biosynthesis
MSRSARPLVSVVMAAYDMARYVEGALASLLAQTLSDLEVLVADDGSADRTPAIVEEVARRDSRVRLLRMGRNRGQAAALNAAVDAARGRYLAVLDADDEATPTRLADQVEALGRDPGLLLVGGAVQTFQDRRPEVGALWRYALDDADIRVRNLFKSEFISGAMTFDRERLDALGLRFDPRVKFGADWDLSSRALRMGRAANLPQVVLRYRLHGAQMTSGMMDDLSSDSAGIRREALHAAGAAPSDDELRVHLAVSPCNYWPFGTHTFFAALRGTIAGDAARWFERLRYRAARGGAIPGAALEAYLAEITAEIARCLGGLPGEARRGAPLHPVRPVRAPASPQRS